MLEPNVYSMCLLLNILLVLEFDSSPAQLGELFRVKSWKASSQNMDSMTCDPSGDTDDQILPNYEDTSVMDAYHTFLNWASDELFFSDNVRPVNYFLGWLQTVLWMFSRMAKPLKPFIKPKLVSFLCRGENVYIVSFLRTKVAQLSEYLPLQFPIEKVLSILDLSNSIELEYASMVITRDYDHLQGFSLRSSANLLHAQHTSKDENNATTNPVNLTRNINAVPLHL